MASLAVLRNIVAEPDSSAMAWNQDGAREKLLGSLNARRVRQSPAVVSLATALPEVPPLAKAGKFDWRAARTYLIAAAALLLGISVAYQYGYQRGRTQHDVPSLNVDRESPLREEVAKLQAERSASDRQLAAERQTINTLTARRSQQETQITELKNLRSWLTVQSQRQTEALAAAAGDREELLRRLQDSEKSLKAVRDDLSLQRANDGWQMVIPSSGLEKFSMIESGRTTDRGAAPVHN